MRNLLVALCCLACSAGQAKAEMDVKDYKARMASNDTFLIGMTQGYIKGLGEGIFWSDVAVTSKNNVRIFCLPEKLVLNGDNYINIIDAKIKELSTEMAQIELDGKPIVYLLLKGLQETFPCKAK